MALRFGPTRGEADNFGGHPRPRSLTDCPRADSIMARNDESSTKRQKI